MSDEEWSVRTFQSRNDELGLTLTMTQRTWTDGVLYSLMTDDGDVLFAGHLPSSNGLTQAVCDSYLDTSIDVNEFLLKRLGIIGRPKGNRSLLGHPLTKG